MADTARLPVEPIQTSHPWRTALFAVGVIAIAAFAAYRGSFAGALLMDDDGSIVNNASIRHLLPLRAVLVPPADSNLGGRPLANLTFALNYSLGGQAVGGYHALNLVIHALAGLALYGVVRRTLVCLPRPPILASHLIGRFSSDSHPLALAIAVIWTVHPLLTDSVTYISQRTETLMGLFYLTTLYAFIRGTKDRPRFWLSLSVAACAAGMGCKEPMATAPVLVLLYDRAFVAGSFVEAGRRRWRYYAALSATWLPLGYAMAGLGRRGAGYGSAASWWLYALNECKAVPLYLKLTLWPRPLVFDYGPVYLRDPSQIAPWAAALALLLATALYLLLLHPRIGFLAGAFFLILLPTSSVIPVAFQPIAENRAYLPSAAIVTLAILGAYALVARPSFALLALLVPLLVFVTAKRNEIYRSPDALWTDTLAKRPANPRAYVNLGNWLIQRGDAGGAKTCFEKAIGLKPDYAEAHNDLGGADSRLGRLAEARAECETALRLAPDLPEGHNNLGGVLLKLGRTDEALGQYQEAVRLRPGYAKGHCNLGVALMHLGKADEARRQFSEALRLLPDYVTARDYLARAQLAAPSPPPESPQTRP